jgi:hypothetical protein
MVIPSLLGWNRLPPEARAAIRKRVREGEGLVLVHPTTSILAPGAPHVPLPTNHLANPGKLWPGQGLWNLSPLVSVESDGLSADGTRIIPPNAVAEGPWRTASTNFIDANMPLAAFPYRYRAPHAAAVEAGITTGAGSNRVFSFRAACSPRPIPCCLAKPWCERPLHLRPGNRIVRDRSAAAGSPAPIRPFGGVPRQSEQIQNIQALREYALNP